MKVGVEMFVASYGKVAVEDVPPLLARVTFLMVIRPALVVGVGLGVGVTVGLGVGVAVGEGVGVGVDGGAVATQEYRSRVVEPVPAFVTMLFVVAFKTACVTVLVDADGFAAR